MSAMGAGAAWRTGPALAEQPPFSGEAAHKDAVFGEIASGEAVSKGAAGMYSLRGRLRHTSGRIRTWNCLAASAFP